MYGASVVAKIEEFTSQSLSNNLIAKNGSNLTDTDDRDFQTLSPQRKKLNKSFFPVGQTLLPDCVENALNRLVPNLRTAQNEKSDLPRSKPHQRQATYS